MAEPQKITLPALNTRKWSKVSGKAWNGPKYARFRLFVQYYNGNAKYHSYDYTKKTTAGIAVNVRSELIGLTKLMELMHKKTKGKVYRYANIFCNITNDTNTTTGNFDYLVCTIVSGRITWKDPIYWKAGIENNMLDITRMKAFAAEKYNKDLAEQARMAVQTSMEQALKQNTL